MGAFPQSLLDLGRQDIIWKKKNPNLINKPKRYGNANKQVSMSNPNT